MPRSREGTVTVTISKDNLYKLERAQRESMVKGIYNENSGSLQTALGGFLTALGFICSKAPTAVGVAIGVVSVANDLVPNEKDILNNLSNSGLNWIREQYDFMYDNPEYDLIEIKYPYLEYLDIGTTGKNIRFVTGKGILTKVHVKGGGWIIA
jgi:hypothetical protein